MTTENQNPYSPPGAAVSDPKARPGSPVKAVLLGAIVDIVGTLVVGTLVAVTYGASLAASGASVEDIDAMSSNIPVDSWQFIVGLLIGCGFSLLGGYVCARIAKRSEYKLGCILGGISVLAGLLIGMGEYSSAIDLSLILATFAAVLLGSHLGCVRNRNA
jgi:hypothetical protein